MHVSITSIRMDPIMVLMTILFLNFQVMRRKHLKESADQVNWIIPNILPIDPAPRSEHFTKEIKLNFHQLYSGHLKEIDLIQEVVN